MRRYRFTQLDVFTDTPFMGNPLAVFPDAEGLTDEEMQRIAREMNLSETTFVLPVTDAGRAGGADVRVRIFTPTTELPYAGHPSVGTHWLLAAEGVHALTPGERTRVVQEVGAGLLRVEIDADKDGRPGAVFSTQRKPRFGPRVEDRAALANALGLALSDLHDTTLPAEVVDTGIPWLLVPVKDADALARVSVQPAAFAALAKDLETTGLYPFCVTGEEAPLTKARGFVVGEFEDPVTGSASGCLAAFAAQYGLAFADPDGIVRFEHAQGEAVKRPGRVSLEVPVNDDGSAGTPRIGGACVKVLEGTLEMP